MIGDSWQLRKYSLLGHWAVHCVEPPGPWHTCKMGRRREGGRWGWVNKSENRRVGELAKNQQGNSDACANIERATYTDGQEERGMEEWEEGKGEK